MQDNNVIIKNKESKDVDRLIISERKKLKKNKRKIVNDMDIPLPKSRAQKIFGIFTDLLIVPIFLISCLLCVANIYSKFNNRSCTLFGYTFMRIASGSMTKTGFNIGDTISVRAVNTDTLKPGDDIAYYVYAKSYKNFSFSDVERIENFDSSDPEYLNVFKNFFGVNNPDMKTATMSNSNLVFHKIMSIYVDENGDRWFVTKGTSNVASDLWIIKDSMILGVHDDSKLADIMAQLVSFLTTIEGVIVCLIIPLCIFCLLQLKDVIVYIRLAFVENELITGKRSLKNKVCQKYSMGYTLRDKDKYRVLISARPEDLSEYTQLLWRDYGKIGQIKKYAIRKNVMLKYYEDLERLKEEANQMYVEGKAFEEIEEHYKVRVREIEQERLDMKKKLKEILKRREKGEPVQKKEDLKPTDSKDDIDDYTGGTVERSNH